MGLVQEHFQKLYKKIIFLNQNVGKKMHVYSYKK